jgi:hypothetical protein
VGTRKNTAELVDKLAPDDAAADVLEAVPRLMKVTALTAISFALWEGVNRTIGTEKRVTHDAREIADGYRSDCAFIAVVRLALLLDSDAKTVSFQRVYRHLNRPEVVTALRRRVRAGSRLHVYPDVRSSVRLFLQVYKRIDWKMHGRLLHFRNIGVAHLTLQEIKKRITYRELRSFVHLVASMAECLEPLAGSDPALRKDEIADLSNRAATLWRIAFRAAHKARLSRIS